MAFGFTPAKPCCGCCPPGLPGAECCPCTCAGFCYTPASGGAPVYLSALGGCVWQGGGWTVQYCYCRGQKWYVTDPSGATTSYPFVDCATAPGGTWTCGPPACPCASLLSAYLAGTQGISVAMSGWVQTGPGTWAIVAGTCLQYPGGPSEYCGCCSGCNCPGDAGYPGSYCGPGGAGCNIIATGQPCPGPASLTDPTGCADCSPFNATLTAPYQNPYFSGSFGTCVRGTQINAGAYNFGACISSSPASFGYCGPPWGFYLWGVSLSCSCLYSPQCVLSAILLKIDIAGLPPSGAYHGAASQTFSLPPTASSIAGSYAFSPANYSLFAGPCALNGTTVQACPPPGPGTLTVILS